MLCLRVRVLGGDFELTTSGEEGESLSLRLEAGDWGWREGSGRKGSLKRSCGWGFGLQGFEHLPDVEAWGVLRTCILLFCFDFFKCEVLFMPFSFASSTPLFMKICDINLHCFTLHTGFGTRLVASPPPPVTTLRHYGGRKNRKAQLYLDLATISGMKLPTKCNALGLSYGLLLREQEYHEPEKTFT